MSITNTTFKQYLNINEIEAFEKALRQGAEYVGLFNSQMIWTKNELRCELNGVLISGLDFNINPINGRISATLKPPQNLSALVKVH